MAASFLFALLPCCLVEEIAKELAAMGRSYDTSTVLTR